MERTMQQMLQQLQANQKNAVADQARMEAKMNNTQESIKQMMARTDDNRERARDLKRMMKEMDTTRRRRTANMKKCWSECDKTLSSQAKMRSTLNAWLI
jgi:hypothetical protein